MRSVGATPQINLPAHRPSLLDRAVIAHRHQAEQQVRRLLERRRLAVLGDQGLPPGQRRRSAIAVEHDEVGFLAGGEVADQIVDVKSFGAA